MPQDNLYWVFSSSAQSISAFIALLLAGFALVHAMMDSAQAKDESLAEIHAQLESRYYRGIRMIAILTASSILASLSMVYINAYSFSLKPWLMLATSFLDAAAIIAGVVFVISMIDPNRYRKTAEHLIKEDRHRLGISGPKVNKAAFFDNFIRLESHLRNFLLSRPLGSSPDHPSTAPLSFRRILDMLRANRYIDEDLYGQLLEIASYRNLVFHGRLDEVDAQMLTLLDTVSSRVADQLRLSSLPTYSIRSSADGRLYFVLTAEGGQPLLTSEVFDSREALERGIEEVRRNVKSAGSFSIRQSTRGQFYFLLVAPKLGALGMGELYESKDAVQAAIKSVRKVALTAPERDIS
jgi:uncharacterized protein YegP (UPF0339 family)/uncharacterized membrane protein